METTLNPSKLPNNNQKNENLGRMEPGTILSNRYQILEVLGIGGMGSVYKARDIHFSSMEKLVAVKEVINQELDPIAHVENIQNFEREAGLLASLDHPSIPVILDYFSNEQSAFLVMEYIHGRNLETIIKEEQVFIDEEILINWAIDVCEVLSYLHDHKPEPIVFLDIKPSNLLLDPMGKIFLIDFGIAKAFQSLDKGTMRGTAGYSAPEQYRGISTPLVDIYALGATLHYLITRRDPTLEPPFSFNERPIRSINPSISSALENIIMKALEFNPESRFQSAKAMKDALLEVQNSGQNNNKDFVKNTIVSDGKQPLWIFKCGDEIRGTVLPFEDSIYFGSYDTHLYSLRATDGTIIWKYKTEAGIVSTPVIYENELYFGSEDQRLHVINRRTGKINWTYYTGGRVCSSPRIAEGHVFVGSDDSHLHAVNLMSSHSVWRFEAASPIRSTPNITSDMIYFGSESGVFYALDFHGDIIWTYSTKMGVSSSPISNEGLVFFSSRDSYVYALDTRGGWIKWRFHMGKGSNSSPCIKNGILFIGSADGNIYALDSHTGKEIWHFPTQHQVSSSPVIEGDELFCGSADGNLYCLDSKSGTLRWKFNTQGAITGSPVIMNGVVFIGSLDHCMYALPV